MNLLRLESAVAGILICTAANLHAISPPSPSLLEGAWNKNRSFHLPDEEYGPVRAGAIGGELLLLLCDTADRPADRESRDIGFFRERFSGGEQSVSAHWFEATRGQVSFGAEVVGWIRLPRTFSEYANDLSLMARHAFAGLPGTMDWERFDWDGDGSAEGVVIVHSGVGAEESGSAADIWSQVRRFQPVDGDPPAGMIAYVPEVGKLGVYAHEVGHLLGLPDLYDRSLQSMGLGIWSLMAYGTWAGNGEHPTGLDGWSLHELGVAAGPPPPGDPWSLEFSNEHRGPLSIESDADPWEYFIASWRSRIGIDSLLPAEGLEILHINDRFSGNNSSGHYQVAMEQADGRYDLERSNDFRGWGDGGDLYPGVTDNLAFNASSTPSSRFRSGLRSGVALQFHKGDGFVIADGTSRAPLGAELQVQSLRVVKGGRLGRLLPGEECFVRIGIQNRGNAPSPRRELNIVPLDDYLRALDGVAELVPLEPGEWTTDENALSFEVRVDRSFHGLGRAHFRIEPDSIWLGEAPLLEIGIVPADRDGWPVDAGDTWGVGDAAIANNKLIVGDRRGRLRQIDAEGVSRVLAELSGGGPEGEGSRGVLSGRCAVADLHDDNIEEIAAITETGVLHLLESDGRLLPGWPVDLEESATSGPALFRESDGSWSVAVSVGDKLHRLDVTGKSRPGWPVHLGGRSGAPSLLRVAGEALLAAGDDSGRMHLLDLDGDEWYGWPVDLVSTPSSRIVIADFGEPVLAVACVDGTVHAFRPDASEPAGWPVKTSDSNSSSQLASADMNGDGNDEIVAALNRTCRLLDRRGETAPGWPVGLMPGAHASLLLADMGSDGDFEILSTSQATGWFIWNREGRLIPGSPLPPEGLAGASLLGDLDNDGRWELYGDDSSRGWQSFALSGEVTGRSSWAITGGDGGATGNAPPPDGEIPDLGLALPDSAALRHDVWAGDSIEIKVIVVNRGSAPSDAALLRSGWSGENAGLDGVFRSTSISGLMPEDSIIVKIPARVPYLETNGTSFTVQIDAARGEIDPRDNSISIPIGPTVPGEPITIPGYGLAPTEIDFRDGILYRLLGGWIVPHDLEGGRDLGDRAQPGDQISAGPGYYLFVSGGQVIVVNIETGDRAVLSQPGSEVCCPHAGGENPIWLESRCGGNGAITIHYTGEDRIGYVPCENRIEKGPILAGEILYWIEESGGAHSLMSFVIDSGESRTLYTWTTVPGPFTCDSSGVVFVEKENNTSDLMFYDTIAETVRVITSREGTIHSIAMDDGIVVWCEESAAGVDLFGARTAGGRVLPLCLAAGDQREPAISGGTVFWIDGRSSPAFCRGLRLRSAAFEIPVEPESNDTLDTAFQLQYVHIREEGDRVLLEWRVLSGAGSGDYCVYRTSGELPRFEDAVKIAGGIMKGRGYYYCEDLLSDLEWGELEFHYYLEIGTAEGRDLRGPLSIRIENRPGVAELISAGPNPSAQPVRFTLELPAQPAAGKGKSAIDVFDVCGRRIRSTRFEAARPGKIDLEWDLRDARGRRVSSGIYFVRVSVGETAFSPRKVIVLGEENEG